MTDMQAAAAADLDGAYGRDLSDDQLDFAQATRRMLTREWPSSAVREAALPAGTGHSPQLWQHIVEAGWLSLAFDEAHGGDSGSFVDLGVIVREAGRVLVPTTFTATLQAGLLLAELGSDDQVDRWLRPLIEGGTLATVATAEERALYEPSSFETMLRRTADGWRLSGRKLFVENAAISDLLVVACRVRQGDGPGGLALCLVSPDDPGVEFRRHATFAHDLQHEVVLTDVPLDHTRLLGFGSASAAARFDHVGEIMAALTSLEMIGGAQAIIETSVEYLNTRHAFGKPIGSFQAVQHLMANAAMAVGGAELAAWQAVWRLATGRPATRETAIAKVSAGRAFRDTTVTALQVWGGSGYTEENDLHLFARRAVTADLRHGSAAFHYRRLADHLKD
jgi:alkylation response protein AidB-like acyl-CoA dehydrogenase